MSNRKNPRRHGDKFTGRTEKWYRTRRYPRGLYIYGDTPGYVHYMKRHRARVVRHTTVIVVDEEEY